ncbi:uncharacterized protein Z518_02680 [Rhinocladiella mackenziei CBS 650.93]|uniref:U3 small nucleolar RNA-associated protein 10 n=1 Tax=Rhinocladiella mackenziei CBS 650.93 TaxID=1442369 RepID=A0A0D2JFK0_9EURO|nr:uncharacterized protein Z518_02680 [Rhinocladiella mackenziei CBS 650.93]KIX08025.1 hypothetical protein Z518_02680 [Rhinocladiella mackenziei CBS 650.93]
MTTTFAAQLRTIAANSTNELDLRARRDAHGESLIFERNLAVQQDWETVYQICVDGFQELCRLDSRLREFDQNLYSPQAKNQDREQLNKTQNEALGVVIERCLALLGGKVMLRPGVRAVEWLVRRFRVHVYNTRAFLLTFLPHHEAPVFRNVLSIIPANKITGEWKFLGPYHKVAANIPRHALVYTATHDDAFFSVFNHHTLRVCQEGASYPQLLRFWGSIVVESVRGRLNQVKSGRKEVQKQRLEDALLKILPALSEGLGIKDCAELTFSCFTISLVLSSNSELEDRVIDSLVKAISPFITDGEVDPKSTLACLCILVARKTEKKVSKDVLERFMKISNLQGRLLELRAQVPVDALCESLIRSSLTGLKISNLNSRFGFVEKVFDISLELFEPSSSSGLVAVLLRKLQNTSSTNALESAIRAHVIRLLQKLNESASLSSTFYQAVELTDQSLPEVEAIIEGTIEPATSVLIKPDLVDVDGLHAETESDPDKAEQMLAVLPSQSTELSFLKPNHSTLFDQLVQVFELCHKTEANLAKFQDLALWRQQTRKPSDLQTSFLLRVANLALPVSERASALRMLSRMLEREPRLDCQLLLPYLTVLLADPARPIRRATVTCLTTIQKCMSENSEAESSTQKDPETMYDGVTMAHVKRIPPLQVVKLLSQVYLPTLEECILDGSHIRKVLQIALDGPSRPFSAGTKTWNIELKKSLKQNLYDLLTSCAVNCPLTRVKIGVVELLIDVHKVGTTTTSKALTPILRDWASLSDTDATSIAMVEGLSLPQIDTVMVQLINARDKEAVEHALAMLEEEKLQPRLDLIEAFFGRIAAIWKEMRHESQISSAVRLFDMSFSDTPSHARGSRHVLHSVTHSTDVLATLLDHACSGLAQMQMEVPPKKRRRISHGRESIPKEMMLELHVAGSRLTFALEIVENSQPESHPQLLGNLFEVLITLRRLKDKSASESPYLFTLCLGSILAIIDKARDSRKPNIDMSSIRADLVIDCVRSSENPQVQATALLLSASLASLVPDRILHTIMPIFTFMGHNILSKDDERSIYVTNQAIDQIIPPLVCTLKRQDASNLVHSTSSLLSSFVAAYDHVPQHRRVAFYQRLLNRLGADDFSFAIIALLSSRRHHQDMSTFLSSLMGVSSAATQLLTFRKIIELVTDIFSQNPHNAEPLLDITRSSKNDKREREALVLLRTASKLLEPKRLKSQVKEMCKTDEAETRLLWTEFKLCIPKLLAMMKDQKASHPSLTSSTKTCLSALLELPSLAELLHITPDLLQEMEQVGDQELQPLVLRVLATQLQHNAPKDTKTQSEAISILLTIEKVITTTKDEQFRHAAITCLDRVVEIYGRKSPEAILSTVSLLIDREYGLKSPDSRTQIMSLLCLASVMEVLKEAAVPIVPPAMTNVLDLLKASLKDDIWNAELHNAAFALISSFISHVPFMISDGNVAEILHTSYQSSTAKLEASCKESRTETLNLLAHKIDLVSIATGLNQVWKALSDKIEAEAVMEYLDLLSQAIERNSKSTVAHSADAVSTFVLQVLDLRRPRASSGGEEDKNNLHAEVIEQIESKLQALGITFIYKLNDTTFRPVFESWIDWAMQGSDLSVAYSDQAKTARLTSLFNFIGHFFATLKSIVTSYASYILDAANEILRSVTQEYATGDKGASVSEASLALYESTLHLLTAAMTHDADGFFAFPAHFSPLFNLLVAALKLSSAKLKALRNTVSTMVIPALVSLATATQDTPAHHHALNHELCQLRHHGSSAVRLAAIRTQLALTQAEDVGEEWVNNVVVGTTSTNTEGGGGVGVGGSGETMVYVNESLEDDEEEVESEVRRWVNIVREMVGEDVFEV